MKKILLLSLICLALLSLASHSDGRRIHAFAKSSAESEQSILPVSDIGKDLENEINKGLNDLITGELENFFNELDNAGKHNFASSFRGLVEKILKGETVSADTFLALIWGGVRDNVFSLTASLVTIVILSVFFGISKNINSGFVKESTGQIIYYMIYASVIAVLCAMLNSVILDVKRVITLISRLVEISFPVLLTLMTAMGGSASASVYQPATLIITKVVVNVIEFGILPLFYGATVFTIIGNLTNNVKLEKLTNSLKSIAKWALGAMFGVITALLTVQGVVGASIDTVSIRSAKFALSSYVPILGGYLSEGFDIIMASAFLLKNAVGLASVIILFIIILGPVVRLVSMGLLMKLTAGIIEPMADSRISNLLYATSKNISILTAIVLGLAFLVFSVFLLIIFTFNMGVA
ncbi:MAG: stage III sporulation protein AE [Firmicutes bacterium]|nr:stage III sporulation protein AE [Bacillota bacterium]